MYVNELNSRGNKRLGYLSKTWTHNLLIPEGVQIKFRVRFCFQYMREGCFCLVLSFCFLFVLLFALAYVYAWMCIFSFVK
jgi:hypothetical protein